MNSKEFLASVHSLTANEVHQLAALLADAFSKFNDGDRDYEKDKKGASFLKGIQRIIKEPNFVKMHINTKMPLFKNFKKGILKDSIDIESLDVQFLLKLMKETSFLNLELKQGKCKRHNGDTCCQYCDHDQEGKKCKQCYTTKSDCGKICCSSCNECLNCQRRNLKDGKDEYLKGKIELNELKQHCKVCWMFPLKESLGILLNCRNLVHEPVKKIEPFFQNEEGSIGEFKNINNLDHICKEIHFAAKVLTLGLSKSKLFDEDVTKKAEEIEERIDKLFYYDGASQLRLVSSPFMEEAYKRFVDVVLDIVKHRFKEEMAQMKLPDQNDEGNA